MTDKEWGLRIMYDTKDLSTNVLYPTKEVRDTEYARIEQAIFDNKPMINLSKKQFIALRHVVFVEKIGDELHDF